MLAISARLAFFQWYRNVESIFRTVSHQVQRWNRGDTIPKKIPSSARCLGRLMFQEMRSFRNSKYFISLLPLLPGLNITYYFSRRVSLKQERVYRASS